MKFKDVCHLYLGCPVRIMDLDGQVFDDKIESVIDDNAGKRFSIYEWGDIPYDEIEDYCQHFWPILRPLSSMTEDERETCIAFLDDEPDAWLGGAKRTAYMLSKHFDLFNLIESSEAIEAGKQ